jgi:outer membrane receptor protein involved in Fe transport
MDTSQLTYNIEAQNLKSALEIYQKTSGLNLAYSDDLVQGKMTDGVDGKNTTARALKKILKDTGLTYTITNQGTVVLKENKMVVAQRDVGKRKAAEEKEEVKRPVAMEEMVVTATKTPINVREVPASVSVVTSEDIKLKARTDNYYDAIRHVPGVYAAKAGFGDALYIRGKAPSMLVNGRDMNPFVTTTSVMVSSMNIGMGSIERIEVIKGPQAAIHGSKAVSGVVNVILKKGDKDNPYVETRGFYGEGDEISGGLSLSGGYDKLSYFLDLSAGKQDEYKTPEGTIPYMDFKRKNVYSRFDYAFSDNHEITFEYTYNQAEETHGGEGYYYKPSAWSTIWYGEPEYRGGFLSYNGNFSDWFSLYTYIGTAKNEYFMVYGRPNHEPEHFLNKENETDYEENILQGEIRGTFNLLSDDRLRTIAGLQYKDTELNGYSEVTMAGVKAPFFEWDKKEEYWAPYIQVEFKPIPHVLMVAGVRYDDYESDEKEMSETNPNFGLSLFPFAHTDYNWTTVWGSYSEAFLTPTAAQRYLPGYLGGNPDLDPEKSKGWEIGLKQRISTWANLEFNYFETDYEDLITKMLVDPVNNVWKRLNIGEAEYDGYELLIEVYPTDWLILHFGYTDSERRDETANKRLYGMPDKIFQYGLTVNDLYGFSFSLWGEQNSDYIIDAEGTSHPSEDDIIWNTKLLYRCNITDRAVFEPFVFFENLTDEKYYGSPGDMPIMEGRAFHVGASLRVNF